ncbi:hypothetical protein KIN20_027970 [Parelaphostrongylus tenuis]|uniref:glucuronosyltransferase n=1 Tax=Parelaphostrongylus tenuis TaxID=148309 RepID=A0AAD5WEK6_PARTN|nr:hypothetical protein KIN20_027970 [Parelaphostrongylus tenuis]
MPNTTFIWKYEEEDLLGTFTRPLPNLYLTNWLPQKALLADARISTFVTHGGLGSTTEIAYMGMTAVMLIPLFWDQRRNANMLARHGSAIVIEKYELANSTKIAEAINAILKDKSYAMNAKKLAEMLVNQPISAKELMIRHAEFAARFGRVSNLDPYGRRLSTIQYYLIDIMFIVAASLTTVFYLLYRIIKALLQIRFRKRKCD